MTSIANDPGVCWLLSSTDPAVRALTLTDVLGQSPRTAAVREARATIPQSPRVHALLEGQQPDGGFGTHPYAKWTGAHWRLVSLVELGIPKDHDRAQAAADVVLTWLAAAAADHPIRRIAGRPRIHASVQGNALAACVRLGRQRDPRVRVLVDRLLETQWPDGGWNCDPSPTAKTSSFYETLIPMWGLAEYARATGDADAATTARRATELFLERSLFRSKRTGAVINPRWLKLHYPLYWHYDILHGLLLLSRVVGLTDPRTSEALDLLESKRDPQGTWHTGAFYWRPPGKPGGSVDVVDWGRAGPNELITLNALRVLRAAGRL